MLKIVQHNTAEIIVNWVNSAFGPCNISKFWFWSLL